MINELTVSLITYYFTKTLEMGGWDVDDPTIDPMDICNPSILINARYAHKYYIFMRFSKDLIRFSCRDICDNRYIYFNIEHHRPSTYCPPMEVSEQFKIGLNYLMDRFAGYHPDVPAEYTLKEMDE